MSAPRGAMAALARFELARRWRSLLVIGLVAGLVGGVLIGAVALARRTATAHDRLEEAVHVEDVRVLVFGGGLAGEVASLRGVEKAWEASLLVAKLQRPGVNYIGITTGPERPGDLYRPIVVEGRAADPADPHQAVAIEEAANALGLRVGDHLPLKLLTPEEVASFDTGFGEPDGPELTLRITGIVRVAGDFNGTPLLATPAFAERYDESSAGTSLFVRLEDRPGARADFLAGATRLNDEAAPEPGAEEFDPIEVTDADRNEEQVVEASRVILGGLAVFVAVVAVVGSIALAQVIERHESGGAAQQAIEAALGLTSGERVLARAIPALFAAAVAGAVAFAIGIGAGVLEPFGAMRRIEPRPGWAPNVAIAAAGALVTMLVDVVVATVAARRAGTVAERVPGPPSNAVRYARAATGRPGVVAGIGLAFAGGRSGRRAPLRYSVIGVVFGIAGVVASMTFASSLDRLASTPGRYGWNADFSVVDVTDGMIAELAADPRVEAVTLVEAKSFVGDGVTLQAYAHTDVLGTTGWTTVEGHKPGEPGQLMLTAKSASRLNRDVGDTISGSDREGRPVELVVTGIGIGPNTSSERLDELALLHPADLDRLSRSQAFTEALVRAGDGEDVDDVIATYAPKYELTYQTMPNDVANVVELGDLPEALGAFLALIAVVALVHLLAVSTSRGSRDLAVLRALGFSRREIGRVVAVASLAVSGIGLVVGVPLGFALGRLVWWSVAHSVGVAPDPSYVVRPTVLLVPVVLLAAVAVALVPARRAARPSVMAALRAE